MNDLERMTALRMYLDVMAEQDFGVVEQVDPFTVEMRQRKQPPKSTNHVLHLILSIVTAGLWAFFWLLFALAHALDRRGYNREPFFGKLWLIHVDEDGRIVEEQIT